MFCGRLIREMRKGGKKQKGERETKKKVEGLKRRGKVKVHAVVVCSRIHRNKECSQMDVGEKHLSQAEPQ